jgi:hypothetical protein
MMMYAWNGLSAAIFPRMLSTMVFGMRLPTGRRFQLAPDPMSTRLDVDVAVRLLGGVDVRLFDAALRGHGARFHAPKERMRSELERLVARMRG